MAEEIVSPSDLFHSKWHELRSELSAWEDYEECFDGLTRFWCKEAVFEVYWVAERIDKSKYKIYLTEDLELVGFKSPLKEKPSLEWKNKLAEALCWREIATAVISEATGSQLELF